MEIANKLKLKTSYSWKNTSSPFILIIFWFIFALIGFLITFKPIKLLFTWIKTTGIIASVSSSTDNDSTVYTPTVYYTCWNDTQIIQKSRSSSSTYNYSVWEEIIIYCDPTDPRYFVIFAFSSYFLIIFFIAGLFMTGLGISVYLDTLRSQKLMKQMLQTGTKVRSTITKITELARKIGKQSTYRIEATDWKSVYKSQNIFGDVPEYVSVWDTIVVWRDLIDPKKYLIDEDSIFQRDKQSATRGVLPKEILDLTTSELIKFRDDQNKLKWYIENSPFFSTLFVWVLQEEELVNMRKNVDEEIKKRQS